MSALLLSSDFLTEWLSDTLLASAILLALVLVVRRPVARYFGPQIAYLLWLIPLARLFMPAITRTIAAPDPVTQPAAMADYIVDMQGSAYSASVAAEPWITPSLLIALWLAGAGLFLVVQLAAYLQHRNEILADAVVLDEIGGVTVIEVAGISGPFAFGLLSKYIALPIGFDRMFTPKERDLALAHELAHHRAGDLWANFIGLVMLSIHWFNPVAWLAWRSFRFDQEAACDARVIAANCDRSLYGRVIAKAATGRTLAFASPLTPQSKIKQRLHLMTQNAVSPTRRKLGIAAIIGVTTSALALSATVSYAVAPYEGDALATLASPKVSDAPVEAVAAPEAPIAPAHARWAEEAATTPEVPEVPEAAPYAPAAPFPPAAPFTPTAPYPPAAVAAPKAPIAPRPAAQLVRHDRDDQGETIIMRNRGGETRMRINDCEGRANSEDFITQTEFSYGKAIKTRVLSCGDVNIDRAEMLKHAAEGLRAARAQIAAMEQLSKAERAQVLAELDSELAQLRAEMEN